jgi:hypothetical protein
VGDFTPLSPVVYIARCPECGLHGERSSCFECGGEVEQVAMVTVEEVEALREELAAAKEASRLIGEAHDKDVAAYRARVAVTEDALRAAEKFIAPLKVTPDGLVAWNLIGEALTRVPPEETK